MDYDVIVIGAGLSGLTAASLLSKRGIKVAVIDKSYNPGGSCGIFKRDKVIYDQGSSMLYGFGETGFNPHRFVFNCLQEPIDVIRHDFLYAVHFGGRKIKFWADIDRFAEELGEIFPSEKENIIRFYDDLHTIYEQVMVENPVFSTPDENDSKISARNFLKHPVSHVKFLSYMNRSTYSLLKQYFRDPEIFKFFNKLTSTYCYTTVEETPAILAAVMFVDNHVGGSYYPAGSTIFLPGKLEKVIEENHGQMILEKEVQRILFDDKNPSGVLLDNGERLYARDIVYSGTVWNLYGKLIEEKHLGKDKVQKIRNIVPTYPSVVLYTKVGRNVIPTDALPIEMFAGNMEKIDESEVTLYITSIDDHTLCDADSHVVIAIGPTLEDWKTGSEDEYQKKKEVEKKRLLAVMERRFPGFRDSLKYAELATPRTIERYANKNGGAVAGPKQMIGQHMFNRMHTKTKWKNLYACGESTVMGTGTPAVTVSGISAANAILKKYKLKEFKFERGMKNYVHILEHPFEKEDLYREYPENERLVMLKARECEYCEDPSCMKNNSLDIRGIMRRVTVGNFVGAKKLAKVLPVDKVEQKRILEEAEKSCIQNVRFNTPVEIKKVVAFLDSSGYGEDNQ